MFHFYHLVSFSTSIMAYLYSTFINSTAARMGFKFSQIGLLNLLWSLTYAFSSITLGHLGDKVGYKRAMTFLYAYMFFVSLFGLFTTNASRLVLFALLQGAFFGAFFPEVEGLLARSERTLGVQPPLITSRFTLSWSSGNIIGVALGPLLTVRAKYLIFAYGLALSLVLVFLIIKDERENGKLIAFVPKRKLLANPTSNTWHVLDKPNLMKSLRFQYRVVLLLAGIVYTSVLAHFPKYITESGIRLEKAGFLMVGANIGVLVTFYFLQVWKSWVGNELVSSILLLVVPMTGILSLMASSPILTFVTALFAGFTYAVPYTFAIFYGLMSEEEGHGKQGAIHEMVIGLLFGFGPFVGGFFFEKFGGKFGLACLAILISVIVYATIIYLNSRRKGLAVGG
ncbi:MFS transporter [Fervidobacterium thailandense]|nr:MFS transporter [Fervidobacterium thailandense]